MPGQRPPKPVFRQLMLDMGDVDDQIVPRGWRGWPTKITTTPEAPPQADTGGKPKQMKPARQKLAT